MSERRNEKGENLMFLINMQCAIQILQLEFDTFSETNDVSAS